MEITGAHWQDVTSIGDGSDQAKSCILRFSMSKLFVRHLVKSESFRYFVTSMVTVVRKTSSCMVATLTDNLKKPGYFHSSYLKFARSLFIKTRDLVIKSLKKQQHAWRYSTSWNAIQFTRLKHLSVEMILGLIRIITLVRLIWCKQAEIGVERSSFSFRFQYQRLLYLV